MSYKTLSQLLPALNDPNRITKKESLMNSFLAGLQNPEQGKLKIYPKTRILSEFWIPETNTNSCKTDLRRLDAFKYTQTKVKKTSKEPSGSNTAVVYEYKIGPLTVDDIINTLYIKNYPNCIVNGTNKNCRNNPTSLKNLYNKIGNPKNALKKLPDIDLLTVVLLGDRITIDAAVYVSNINKTNPYIYRVSKNKKVEIKVVIRTYKQYIETLNKDYHIQWFYEKDIDNEILNLSNYNDTNSFNKINCITGNQEIIDKKSLIAF